MTAGILRTGIWSLFVCGLLFNRVSAQCGDTLCGIDETVTTCPGDCDPNSCWGLYDFYEGLCILKGWRKEVLSVQGVERDLLWKEPADTWYYGAIIILHGGGGAHSNACSNIALGQPMITFCDSALAQGFAVFSLNSTYNRATDSTGTPVGKRWDSCKLDSRENVDLPYIEQVIREVIPGVRPALSSTAVFIAGISNGGFTTILAATHFSDLITAFAPMSCGDPYGTYMDMDTHPVIERACAPGVFRDLETHSLVSDTSAAVADSFPHEKTWPETKAAVPFKQFHHRNDGACDISLMDKARTLLVRHGYSDDGPFVLEGGERTIENHLWQNDYDQPMLDFFKTHSPTGIRLPGFLDRGATEGTGLKKEYTITGRHPDGKYTGIIITVSPGGVTGKELKRR